MKEIKNLTYKIKVGLSIIHEILIISSIIQLFTFYTQWSQNLFSYTVLPIVSLNSVLL